MKLIRDVFYKKIDHMPHIFKWVYWYHIKEEGKVTKCICMPTINNIVMPIKGLEACMDTAYQERYVRLIKYENN